MMILNLNNFNNLTLLHDFGNVFLKKIDADIQNIINDHTQILELHWKELMMPQKMMMMMTVNMFLMMRKKIKEATFSLKNLRLSQWKHRNIFQEHINCCISF